METMVELEGSSTMFCDGTPSTMFSDGTSTAIFSDGTSSTMFSDDTSSTMQVNRRQRRLSGRFIPPPCQEDPGEDDEEEVIQSHTESRRRSSRVKIRPLTSEYSRQTGPKKLSAHSSAKDIEKYYLDKKVKKQNPSLETIYEEPQRDEEVMSSRKFRRVINFSASLAKNSAKVKKRKMKAKSVTANSRNAKKVSLKFLMDKLAEIDE